MPDFFLVKTRKITILDFVPFNAMQAILKYRIVYKIRPTEQDIPATAITQVSAAPATKTRRGRPKKELSISDLEENLEPCDGIDTAKLFVKSLSNVPLLSKEEEVAAAIEIEKANKAVFDYSNLFVGFAEMYVAVIKSILSGDNRLDTYLGEYDVTEKDGKIERLDTIAVELGQLCKTRRQLWHDLEMSSNKDERWAIRQQMACARQRSAVLISELEFNEKLSNDFRLSLEADAKDLEEAIAKAASGDIADSACVFRIEETHCNTRFKLPSMFKEFRKLSSVQAKAKEKMIKSNMRLVFSIARKYTNKGLPMQDIVQEGSIGLMKAVSKFDYRKGFKFSTYATWWVRQAITHAISDKSKIIRIPIHLSDSMSKLSTAQKSLQQEFHREPTEQELADELDLPVSKVKLLVSASRQPVSMQTVVGGEEDSSLEDFLEDSSAESPAEAASNANLADNITSLLEELPERDRQILKYRFGLQDGEPRTLEEVGKLFNVTRERIRQIEAKALKKLRHPKYIERLSGFIER